MTTLGVDDRCELLDDLRCVWIGVPDLEAAADILEVGLGYERRDEGRSLTDALPWLHAEPRPWIYLSAPGEHSGSICIFDDRERSPHIGLPRGWDCVEAVAANVDSSAAALAAFPGVDVVREPFTSDLSELGSNVHRSGVWRMPWGTHLILTQGLTKPINRVFPATDADVGRVFEVHLRTDRFATTRSLYSDVLAMPSLMTVRHTSGPMHDAWSLPDGHAIDMSFLKSGGPGTGAGAIEIQGHPTRALQPRAPGGALSAGGTSMVTYATGDIDAVHRTVGRSGVFTVPPPVTLESGPMAGSRAVLIVGGESECLQIVQLEPAG